MTWGVEQRGLPAAARQELAVRHAPLVRSLAVALVREGCAPRSLLPQLMGAGTQALVGALHATNVPSGPGFERYARAQVRRAMEDAATRRRLAAQVTNQGISEQRH